MKALLKKLYLWTFRKNKHFAGVWLLLALPSWAGMDMFIPTIGVVVLLSTLLHLGDKSAWWDEATAYIQ